MKILVFLCFLGLSLTSCTESKTMVRNQDFNRGWKFSLNEKQAAFANDLDDKNWREVNLPHDWSVEFPFDSVNGEGCTGYLPGGLGWYRKHFSVQKNDNQNIYVLFDGVYNNSEIWLNGQKLGEHPYGYSPFYYDLSPFLNRSGTDNILAVKVDHTRYADSRWYTGSGIYRNVKLITVNKLHIPVWGTFITTPEVSETSATVHLRVNVANKFDSEQQFDIVTELVSPEGKTVLTLKSENQKLNSGETEFELQGKIENPALWGTENPNLYQAKISIIQQGKTIDQSTTRFGIRSIRFDAETGFFLNGENMKIKGVCLHHDGGLVGAAVPAGVWKRRLEILKDGGCNAIRCSHNPPSEEFLDLCDEMGFLVQDEFFDEWDNPKDKRLNMTEQHDDYITRGYGEHFQEWAESDLKSTILAHRNHPSVIQWSIGNEIEWTYPKNKIATGFFNNMNWSGSYFWSQPPFSPEKIKEEYDKQAPEKYEIGATAQKLANWTREMDITRPVIANCILPSASFISGYADALDIVGFSYRRVMYDYARENYPDKTVMGTENLGQWHEWKAIEERPFVSGTFLWTGIDYLGESNGGWPQKGTASGLLDLAGFTKPSWNMYKTLWTSEPHIYICSQTAEKSKYVADAAGIVTERKPGAWEHALWEWYPVNEYWNYNSGEPVIVEVISNCEQVELFLNEKSLGIKKLADFPDRIYKWAVPFAEGKLEAKGMMGAKSAETQIITAGEPIAIQIISDKTSLEADGYDVAHLVIQLIDEKGNPVLNTEKEISFELQGAIKNLGVDNGDIRSTQKFQANKIKTSKGRALLIVQSTLTIGEATINASGDGLKAASVKLNAKRLK